MPSTPSSVPSDPPRSRRARWILAAIAAVVVLGVGALTWVVIAGSDDGSSPVTVPKGVSTGGPKVGQPAPDFTLTTYDGEPVSLSDYRGQPVVLNFWASYCKPCREEFPLIRRELAQNPGEYVVLGVDTKDIPSDGEKFAKQRKATWPIVVDSSRNEVAKAYGVGALPQTFFIDPDGTVALRYYAEIPADDWSDAIATITDAPSGA